MSVASPDTLRATLIRAHERAGTIFNLHPGRVTSKNDRDTHFITATQLASLYGVKLDQCVIGHASAPGYVDLYPCFSGDYILPPVSDPKSTRGIKVGDWVAVKDPSEFVRGVSQKVVNRKGEVYALQTFTRMPIVRFHKEGRRGEFTHVFSEKCLRVVDAPDGGRP